MREKGYLRANAMAHLGRALDLLQPSIDIRRSLSARQRTFAIEVPHEKADTTQRRRLDLPMLGSATGLRVLELATASWQGFRRELADGQQASCWRPSIFLCHQQPLQGDRYSALERSAVYEALRRFLREVAVAASARDGAFGSADFLNARPTGCATPSPTAP